MPRNAQRDAAVKHIKRRARTRVDQSGHGQQVMPRQQDELATSNDHSPNATGKGEDGSEGQTFIDERTLEDLRGK
jgi:hypothetical protein